MPLYLATSTLGSSRANIPTAMRPQIPPTPWMAKDPVGSSSVVCSRIFMAKKQNVPENSPITKASEVATKYEQPRRKYGHWFFLRTYSYYILNRSLIVTLRYYNQSSTNFYRQINFLQGLPGFHGFPNMQNNIEIK